MSKMVKIYVMGDTHFGQESSLKWLDDEGNKLRPFDTVEEMNNSIISNWNNTIKPNDHVYHLGDVAMKKQFLQLIKELNGHKRLVLGNHDIFESREYMEVGFEKLCGVRVFPGLKALLTHIPIHPDCLRDGWINVQGHLHSNNLSDRRYINVSAEQINYTPVLLEEILAARRKELLDT